MFQSFFFILGFSVAVSYAEIPLIPDSYYAHIHYAIRGEFFANMIDQGQEGFSFFLVETVHGKYEAAKIDYFIEAQLNEETEVMKRTILWNYNLTIADKYLYITEFGFPNTKYDCVADRPIDSPLEEILLGIHDDHPELPSFQNLLLFGNDPFIKSHDYTVNNVPCHTYTKVVDEVFGMGKYKMYAEIRYHWSDPSKWEFTNGKEKTAPVAAEIRGTINDKTIDIFMNFLSVFEVNNLGSTDPVLDLWCSDMKGENIILPISPERFMYESEFVFHLQVKDGIANVVIPTVEYFDFMDKISISKYKRMNVLSSSPFENSGPYVRDVKDFYSGVSYKINHDLGNCSINFIGTDDYMGDDIISDDGQVSMISPADLWFQDKKFAVIKGETERGLDVASFLNTEKDEHNIEHTTVVYLANLDSTYSYPVRMLTYTTENYGDLLTRREQNIFNFRTDTGFPFPMDITGCFPSHEISHKIISSTWIEGMSIYGKYHFVTETVRRTLARSAGVSPIRIQNVNVLEVDEEKKVIIYVFTMIGVPELISDSRGYPSESTLPLVDALQKLQTAISDGMFFSLLTNDGIYVKSYVVKDSMKDTDRSEPPSVHSKRYSPGSMALLGISMLIIGGASGFAAYYYYNHRK